MALRLRRSRSSPRDDLTWVSVLVLGIAGFAFVFSRPSLLRFDPTARTVTFFTRRDAQFRQLWLLPFDEIHRVQVNENEVQNGAVYSLALLRGQEGGQSAEIDVRWGDRQHAEALRARVEGMLEAWQAREFAQGVAKG